MLTGEEILSLRPGDQVRITGICFDLTPWTKAGTVVEVPVHDGYYQVGGLGTWSWSNTSCLGETWLPSYRIAVRPKGKRSPRLYRTSDVLTAELVSTVRQT